MFDEGVDVDTIESGDEMKLVYSEGLRQRRCNATLNIDYPDSLYVGPNEGWKNLNILTPTEKETYKIDSPKGLLVVRFWFSRIVTIKDSMKEREMQVGDLKQHPLVAFPSSERTGCRGTVLAWIDSCFVLNGPQGHYWERGSDGHYEIEARVGSNDIADHDILQISSLILL
jgi:hypothetical protein